MCFIRIEMGGLRTVILEGKNFYLGVDCEGAACVVGEPGIGLGAGEQYQFAKKQAAREANAAAQALFDLGAQRVVVWDNHGSGCNLDYDLLDSRVEIVLGSGHKGRFPLLDESFSGVMFLGYHARENTAGAVLAHTYSSKSFQYFKLDGKEVGEMEIDAAFAALNKVPVMFCSSDDKCISQAKEAFPWAETLVTKQSLSWTSAMSRHPAAVCQEIRETVRRAAHRLPEMECYRLPSPLTVEIRYKRMEDAARAVLTGLDGKPFGYKDAFTRIGVVRGVENLF